MTARWVVDEVAPRRNLDLVWQPISLLFKNDPEPGTPYHQSAMLGHRCLRVMEAIRAGDQPDKVFDWYWQTATLIHHDRNREFDLAQALARIGVDQALADAADDETWDAEIARRMGDGLALVGNDVGTPIISFPCDDGARRGIFGPVITRVPDTEHSLAFWDAMVVFASTDGFWEIKRTRTERPEFGERPDV